MSCVSVPSVSCSSRAVRSRTSPMISASTRRRCASGCDRPRPIGLPARSADEGEREELKKLRKEDAELRRANAILKDASVYFATELDPTRRR